jgi:hypothetical protein
LFGSKVVAGAATGQPLQHFCRHQQWSPPPPLQSEPVPFARIFDGGRLESRTQRTNALSCSDQSSLPGRASCEFVCHCFSCCHRPGKKGEEEKKGDCISLVSQMFWEIVEEEQTIIAYGQTSVASECFIQYCSGTASFGSSKYEKIGGRSVS